MKKIHEVMSSITYDKELFDLSSEATRLYGEMSGIIEASTSNDTTRLLLSLIKNEAYKSTQIEGTNVTQSEAFALEGNETKGSEREIYSYRKTIIDGYNLLMNGENFSITYLNKLHKHILDANSHTNKRIGKMRNRQNWIGAKNCTIREATYIPPKPEEVPGLVDELCNFMNNCDGDILLNVAVAHAYFEAIHPYDDGNGRLGRMLIALQAAKEHKKPPILLLSEVIEVYKLNYVNSLNHFSVNGNIMPFIKFFLQATIDQFRNFKIKYHRLSRLKDRLKDELKKEVSTIYADQLVNYIVDEVVFKSKSIAKKLDISKTTGNKYLKIMVEKGYLTKIKSGVYAQMEAFKLFRS